MVLFKTLATAAILANTIEAADQLNLEKVRPASTAGRSEEQSR